jgi:hypothetical protein
VPAETAGVLDGPTTLGEPLRPPFESPQAGAVLRETGVLDEIAALAHRRESDGRLVGIDPDQHLHARASIPVEPAIGVREGHSDFGPCTHLF